MVILLLVILSTEHSRLLNLVSGCVLCTANIQTYPYCSHWGWWFCSRETFTWCRNIRSDMGSNDEPSAVEDRILTLWIDRTPLHHSHFIVYVGAINLQINVQYNQCTCAMWRWQLHAFRSGLGLGQNEAWPWKYGWVGSVNLALSKYICIHVMYKLRDPYCMM